MTEIQELVSNLRREFPGFRERCNEQGAGPEQEISAFAAFVIELYEEHHERQLQTAFHCIEQALKTASPRVRELIACEFLEIVQDLAACKPYASEALGGYLGPETRRIRAELDEISRTCSRLDMRERTVLETEILTWWLLREALEKQGAAA
jgi:hypothetical protein